MSLRKHFNYRVYEPTTITRYNRVREPSFEGYQSSYGTYWQAVSSPTLTRDRFTAHPEIDEGKAMSFDGIDDFVALVRVSSSGLNAVKMSITGRFYRSSWNTTKRMALISKDYNVSGGNSGGWGLHMNYTSGYLSAIAKIAGSFREAKTLLSGISAGWHSFAFTYDGQNLRLYVDGVLQDTYNHGSAGNDIQYSGTNEPVGAAGLGAQYTVNTGVGVQLAPANVPQGNWFDGLVDSVMFWNNSSAVNVLTAAQLLNIHNTGILYQHATDTGHYWTFDDAPIEIPNAFGERAYKEWMQGNIAYPSQGLFYLPSGVANSDVNEGTRVAGVEGQHASLKVVTDTGGATEQGIEQTTSHRVVVVGGNPYTASVYVKGTAGHSVKLKIVSDAGSDQEVTKTLTGGWDRIYLSWTAHASATRAKVQVLMQAAAVSAKTFYIDEIMVEDGLELHDYFDSNTTNDGQNTYTYDFTNNIHVATLQGFTFKTTWDGDVSDEIEFTHELNTAGSEITVNLSRKADDFGEDDDVKFNNRVDIYVVDDDEPNGLRIFSGFILNYKPIYGDNEHVSVTLMGYGYQMEQFVIEVGDKVIEEQPDISGGGQGFNNTLTFPTYIGQKFVVPEGVYDISTISVRMYAETSPADYSTRLVRLAVYDDYEEAKTSVFPAVSGNTSDIALAEAYNYAPAGLANADWVDFTFPEPLSVEPNQVLYFTQVIDSPAGSGEPSTHKSFASLTNVYPDGFMFRNVQGTGNVEYDFDLAFELKTSVGGTTNAFNSYDPADILREIVSSMRKQGGNVVYTPDSIDDTETDVSYTFKTATILDGAKKVLELSPRDWYWYIDQREFPAVIHLHHKSTATIRKFTMGSDIANIDVDKRVEGMVNTVYFVGGELDDGTNLFKKYVNQKSVELYGQKLAIYSDNRVLLESTADIIANTLLSRQSVPELRITGFEILDKAYDIEAVTIGDLSTFKGVSGRGRSLWNRVKWNKFRWNFDHRYIGSLKLQIVKIKYTADKLGINVSSTPLDVSKRIEDIKRNLEKQQTVLNPEQPDEEVVV